MGRFINGVHQSWSSDLGPNERFGLEDDMSFHELATRLANQKQQDEYNDIQETDDNNEFDEMILNLEKELTNYSNCRSNCINLIKNLVKNYPQKNIESDTINKLIINDIAVKKLIDYYSKQNNH